VRSANLPIGSAAAKGDGSRPRASNIALSEIRLELQRILSSQVFSAADRMTRFLRFVVEETLEGKGDNLNELLLGMAVYDRDRKFDPRVDSIVRVDAGRLRAKLREFYASEGEKSQIAIEIPKGSYKAVFKQLQGKNPLSTLRSRAKQPVATKSFAVLPFVDLSPGKDSELLGEAIGEELLHALSSSQGIRVVSRTSVVAFKGDRIDVKELGRQLGVEYFIEGSVRRANRKIRVLVRLTDAATGFHTWSKLYSFVSRDVFRAQERVSKSVAQELRVIVGTESSVGQRNASR
jgi:TolB-like protein